MKAALFTSLILGIAGATPVAQGPGGQGNNVGLLTVSVPQASNSHSELGELYCQPSDTDPSPGMNMDDWNVVGNFPDECNGQKTSVLRYTGDYVAFFCVWDLGNLEITDPDPKCDDFWANLLLGGTIQHACPHTTYDDRDTSYGVSLCLLTSRSYTPWICGVS